MYLFFFNNKMDDDFTEFIRNELFKTKITEDNHVEKKEREIIDETAIAIKLKYKIKDTQPLETDFKKYERKMKLRDKKLTEQQQNPA